MAFRKRIRRKRKRHSAPPQKLASRELEQQRGAASAILIGGAKDPAETAADTMAAQVLSGKSASVAGPASTTPGITRSESTSATIASGNKAATAPATAQSAISALGGGRPMATGERASFEPGFGRSFADVRIHEGAQADTAARSIDADAFTDGKNIAFANGQASPENMAHELAHVARRDIGIRRVIETRIDTTARYRNGRRKPSNMTYMFRDGYKVANTKRTAVNPSKHYYHCSSVIKAGNLSKGPVNTEIASAMLTSTRIFRIRGTSLRAAVRNLRRHHKARQRIVKLADNIQLEFSTSNPSLIEGLVWFVHDETMKRLNAELDGMDPVPPKHVTRKMYQRHMRQALKDEAGTKRFRKAAKEALKVSKDWSKHKRNFLPPYACSCFLATAFVMYGAGGKIRHDTKSFPVEKFTSGDEKIKETANYNDWVPGDWGYVANTHAPGAKGQEGENMIYKGGDMFWAHSDHGNVSKTLEGVLKMVGTWNPDGTAKLSGRRGYPKVGLK